VTEDGLIAGYERERITALNAYEGGAEWEYRYQDGGAAMQVIRMLFTIGGRSFVISWSTTEIEWPINMAHLGTLRGSLRAI
jgi:hypothetical protein